MWQFLVEGGPVMFLLVIASVVSLTFVIERGLALRWNKVLPPSVEEVVSKCSSPGELALLQQVCESRPSALSRLLLVAVSHLDWPKTENENAIETRARHEIIRLERGLVVLEIIVGIAPLLGLVGAVHGLITLFGDLGTSGLSDNAVLAKGIAIALHTTLVGLLVAIPTLIAWSYYNRKVETLTVELETLCDEFLRQQYRGGDGVSAQPAPAPAPAPAEARLRGGRAGNARASAAAAPASGGVRRQAETAS
jgi:biopolymer transport protein ExbB